MSMNHFCEQASRLMSESFERQLSLYERLRLKMHLWICTVCRRFERQLHLLHRLFERLRDTGAAGPADASLSGEDRERIQAAIKQAATDQDKSRDSS